MFAACSRFLLHEPASITRSTIPKFAVFRREKMAHPRGFEPLASAFGGQRSIQLSYGCVAARLAVRGHNAVYVFALPDKK